MSELRKSLPLSALLIFALSIPLSAQDAPQAPAPDGAAETAPVAEASTPTPDEDLSLGEQVEGEGIGDTYVEQAFGDWEMRCVRTPDDQDPCQLYQLLHDEEGNSVAEVSLFALPEGQEAAAGATIITPLETLLTQQITLRVDQAAAKRYPFTWCSQIGCIARVGFTSAEVDTFKRGSTATMTIVPVAAPDQQVALDISLSGFTAGYDAVAARNAELPPE